VLTIPNGSSAVNACNGSDFIEVGSSTVGNFNVNGNLTVTGTTTLSGGTANGVAYLNGSKVLTTGTALVFDGTNLGVGVTPSAWASTWKGLEILGGYLNTGTGNAIALGQNLYVDSGINYVYKTTNYASVYQQNVGQHQWYSAPSGTAGTNATLTTTMLLDSSGKLGIGTTTLLTKFTIQDTERLEFGGLSGVVFSQALNGARTTTVENRTYSSFTSWWTGASGSQAERMRLDTAGNLGLGAAPSAWSGALGAGVLQIAGGSTVAPLSLTTYNASGVASGYIASNGYYNGTNWVYTKSNYAAIYEINNNSGKHLWSTAPSGTAGNTITFTQAMTLNSSGYLGIGATSPNSQLDVRFPALTSGTQVNQVLLQSLSNGVNSGFGARTGFTFSNRTVDYSSSGGISTSGVYGIDLDGDVYGRLMGLVFYTSSIDAAATEKMRIDDAGNLGLGVTPSAWIGFKAFQMPNGSALYANNTVAALYLSANTINDGTYKYSTTDYASQYYQYQGQHIWRNAPSGTAGNAITFTQAMTLDASGNLGIGTTSPAARLDVFKAGTADQYWRTGTVNLYASADTSQAKGIFGTLTNHPLTFYTNGAEVARIDTSGNLLVGTTDSGRTTGIGIKLDIAGYTTTPTVSCVGSSSTNSADTYHVYSTGASAYRFYVGYGGTVNATSTTITGISDQRLKENIRDLDDGLLTVMSLKPRKFDWKAGKGKDIKNDRGFIAQEFEQVLPDMIEEWRDPAPEGEEPYKAVNANLIPTLVKAIQEQQAIIESLKARLDAANL
jgi:hypothetical protein